MSSSPCRPLRERSPSPGANPSTPQSIDSQPTMSETSTGLPHFVLGHSYSGSHKRRRGPASAAAEAVDWAQALRRSTRNASGGDREGGSSSSTSPPPKRRLGDHHGTLSKFFLNLDRSKCWLPHPSTWIGMLTASPNNSTHTIQKCLVYRFPSCLSLLVKSSYAVSENY